jgi:hypothetical protein
MCPNILRTLVGLHRCCSLMVGVGHCVRNGGVWSKPQGVIQADDRIDCLAHCAKHAHGGGIKFDTLPNTVTAFATRLCKSRLLHLDVVHRSHGPRQQQSSYRVCSIYSLHLDVENSLEPVNPDVHNKVVNQDCTTHV